MNKATPITIAGRVFYLEDPGYDMLQRYIESLRGYFAGNEARHEIMADIEGRIAERFAELVTRTDQAIPVARVTELMDAIGRPEDIGESGSEAAAIPRSSARKLFRDPRGGVLGGVFAGLSAFAGINPSFMRLGYLAFLAIILLGAEEGGVFAAGLAAYFVLWLVLPAATTSSEWLSMRGAAVTLESLASLVPERLRNPSIRPGLDRVIAAPFLFLRRSLTMVSRAIEGLMTVLKRAFGLAFIAFGTFAVLGISFLAVMGMGGAPAAYLDATFTSFLDQIPFGVIVGFGALVFLIPAIFILAAGVSVFRSKPVMQPAVALGLGGVWFVAIITAGALTAKSVMKWQAFEQTYAGYRDSSFSVSPTRLTKVDAGKVPVRMIAREGKETKVQIRGRRQELERLSFTLEKGALVLAPRDAEEACVICDRRAIEIEVTSPMPDSIEFQAQNYWRVQRPYIEERKERARIAAEASGDSTQAREDALLERVPPEVRDELRRALRGRGGEASRF